MTFFCSVLSRSVSHVPFSLGTRLALLLLMLLGSLGLVHVASAQFAITFGGPAFYDASYAITVDGSGNSYVTGNFWSTVDFDPGPGIEERTATGDYDIYVASYDAAGNFRFVIALNALGEDDTGRSWDIALDGSGNIYITGTFRGTVDFDPGPGTQARTADINGDIFIASYDAAGTFRFAHAIGEDGGDTGSGIAVDGSDNIYVTGDFDSRVDFDPGPGRHELTPNDAFLGSTDAFVASYDAAGTFRFAHAIGGSESDIGLGIAVDGSGNSYVTGWFRRTVDFDPGAGTQERTATGDADIFIASYDAAGTFRFASAAGGDDFDTGANIAVDGSGNSYVTGSFNGTVDFDPGAGTQERTSNGDRDSFVASYDGAGNFRSVIAFGGEGRDRGLGIGVDGSGNSYVTGVFASTVDFDPGPDMQERTANGEADIFVASYDGTSTFRFAHAIGGDDEDQRFFLSDIGYDIAVDNFGNSYVTGVFSDTVDFDLGPGIDEHTSNGEQDMFILSLPSSLPRVDIAVEKTVDKEEAEIGEGLTFTITVTNDGPGEATGVDVTDVLPAGLSYASSNSSQGTYTSSTGLWEVGTLADGASATLEITATVDQEGPITNTAEVTASDQPDSDSTPDNDDGDQSEDDEDSATVTGQAPSQEVDLELAKTVDEATPYAGNPVVFTLALDNNGSEDATGVAVTDLLPAGLTYVSDDGGGAFDETTGTWTVGALAQGATATLQITATVDQTGAIENVAEVTASDQADPDSTPGNDDGDQSEDDEAAATITGVLAGDVDDDEAIMAQDAALTLRHSVSLITLTGMALTAAEVSGDATATAFDASFMLRHSVDLITCFPVEDGCPNEPVAQQSTLAWGEVQHEETDAGDGTTRYVLPLLLSAADGDVFAIEVEVPLPEGLTLEQVQTHLPESWLAAHHVEADTLRLALAGSMTLEAGTVATLTLVLAGATDPGGLEDLGGQGRINGAAWQALSGAGPTTNDDAAALPKAFVLEANYPNPFNPQTTIGFALPQAAEVRLVVYDVLGREVTRLAEGTLAAGRHEVVFDASGLPTGLYVYRLQAGRFTQTRRMLLVK